MKYLAIVLAFLTTSACSNLTELKTTVEVKSDTSLTDVALENLQNQLQKRFDKSEFRNTNIATGDQPNQLIITAKVDTESEREMQRYRAMFTSNTLDLWDTYRITDPEVAPFVTSLPKISGFAAQNPENGGMLATPEVLGFCDNESLLTRIIDSLKMLPDQPENIYYLWSTEIDEKYRQTGSRFELYMIDTKGKKEAPLTDRDIIEANGGKSEYTAEPEVYFQFDESGTKRWASMSERAAMNDNRSIAIVINNRVFSAPRVMSPITGGSCALSGNFTPEEAQELALKIDVGRLDYPLEVVDEGVVEE